MASMFNSAGQPFQLNAQPNVHQFNNPNNVLQMVYPPYFIQGNINAVVPPYPGHNLVTQTPPNQNFYTAFLKAKPKALGIVQIVAAIVHIGLAITSIFFLTSINIISGNSFWGPVFYIISGSLSIAAAKAPSLCLVRGSLSLNVFACIASFIGLIMCSIDIATVHCYGYYYNGCEVLLVQARAIIAVLLIMNILQFCLSLSISIFGCRSLDKVSNSTAQQVMIIPNGMMVNAMTNPVSSNFQPAFAQPQPLTTNP